MEHVSATASFTPVGESDPVAFIEVVVGADAENESVRPDAGSRYLEWGGRGGKGRVDITMSFGEIVLPAEFRMESDRFPEFLVAREDAQVEKG